MKYLSLKLNKIQGCSWTYLQRTDNCRILEQTRLHRPIGNINIGRPTEMRVIYIEQTRYGSNHDASDDISTFYSYSNAEE
jgi:hypothetical protein